MNVGGSIWGLDFAPKPSPNKSSDQYLAIGGYNSTTEHHLLSEDFDINNKLNAIQIWKCRSYTSKFKPVLDMCILHDFGVVVDFKWCPFSVYDEEVTTRKDQLTQDLIHHAYLQILGILAAMFNNGTIRLFVVPHPQNVRKNNELSPEDTVYSKVQPLITSLKVV